MHYDVGASSLNKRTYFTSFSANFEDVMLRRLFPGRLSGFYVDIGSADPVFENDTKLFYDLGWRGINVEPNREAYLALVEGRPADTNVWSAVADYEGLIDYYEVIGTGLSTCDSDLAQQAADKGHVIRKQEVPVTRLASILDQIGPDSIDFLKVDVEGFEEHVLASNDWSRYRPSVIVVEATVPESRERRADDIKGYLAERDYQRRYFDGINDFYVADEFVAPDGVFDSPPNVLDGFQVRGLVAAQSHAHNLAEELSQAKRYIISLEENLAAKRSEADRARALADELLVAKKCIASLEENLISKRLEVSRSHELAEEVSKARNLISALEADVRERIERLSLDLADQAFEAHKWKAASVRLREELLRASIAIPLEIPIATELSKTKPFKRFTPLYNRTLKRAFRLIVKKRPPRINQI